MTGGPGGRTTRRSDDVDLLHGVEVADPYRWLEDGASTEVIDWVADQNAVTRAALDARPDRERWHARLVELMSAPVVQAVQARHGRLVMLERSQGAQQASLVSRSLLDDDPLPRVLVDPAGSADDAAVAVDWFEASQDGSLVAFGLSEGGTEDSELRIVRTGDGTMLDERIADCRAASLAWEHDGNGFWYTRYPPGDQYHRTVRHHRLGDDPSDDPIVWDDLPTPETWPSVASSDDGRRLLVHASVGWGRTDVHVLDRDTGTWRAVAFELDARSTFRFDGPDALVGVTTLGAARGRIVRVDLGATAVGPDTWVEVMAERDRVVTDAVPIHTGLVLATSEAGVDSIERCGPDGAGCAPVDGVGTSSVAQLVRDPRGDDVFAVITGFDRPASVWRVGDEVEPVHPPPSSTDAAPPPQLSVSRVEYPSLDGTAIGLFLIHRHDVTPAPDTPTILNGYGGFAITESPGWSPTIAAWCEAGGLYAIAGLRGGFEHGDEWHRAGRRERKQNVFDDFIAAADWLVDTGRTSRDRLAIAGGSNGGLLVGAALTQRPDLCRAVWCAVPLLDMIRFPEFLIARLWTDEYGDPAVAEEFAWLWAYSPYHRVVDDERYPAILLTTAEGDTRVDPLHARKMAARLQEVMAGRPERPVLLHQEGRAGHGVGKPVGKRAAEQADVLAFLSWQLGVDGP